MLYHQLILSMLRLLLSTQRNYFFTIYSADKFIPKKNMEKERRRQNKLIKKKFSLGVPSDQLVLNPNYEDRASKRRLEMGSDNPYEKTNSASVDQ